MLFEETMRPIVDKDKGESLYFFGITNGITLVGDREAYIRLFGTKLPNGNVRMQVDYMYSMATSKPYETAFKEELTPANFERMLNEMAIKIGQITPGLKIKDVFVNHQPWTREEFMQNHYPLQDEEVELMNECFML
jgi:hypothetical protein